MIIWEPSVSHLAVALVLPWSLFLKIQCVFAAEEDVVAGLGSEETVTSLSCPKPALTKALTKVEARFCRAESTAAPVGALTGGEEG